MDKLANMELFVKVVRHQGFAAAGRELGLSPATMSARIQAMEAAYGVRLLNRTTRRLALTDAGALFYQSCQQVLESVQEAENQLHDDLCRLVGPLRIAAPKDLGKQHILPLLDAFVRDHPEISPALLLSDEPVDMIDSGIDLVIRYGEVPDSRFIARRLAASRRVLCASPAYLGRRGVPQTPADLAQHDCLVLQVGSETLSTWHFARGTQRQQISIRPTLVSNDGEILRHWALAGFGLALKSSLDVADDIAAGRLVTVLTDHLHNFRNQANADLNLIYPSRRYQPRRITTFIERLVAHFGRLA